MPAPVALPKNIEWVTFDVYGTLIDWETDAQLDRFAKKYNIGLISNIDDKLLGLTRRHFRTDFDLVVTAQQVRSYKPDPAHFTECERRIGSKTRWAHVASSYYY